MRDYFGMWYGCLGSMGSGVGAWEIDYVNLITQAQLFYTMLLKVRGVVKYYIRASRYRDVVRPYHTYVNFYERNGICDWLIREKYVHYKYNNCKKKSAFTYIIGISWAQPYPTPLSCYPISAITLLGHSFITSP